MAEEARALPLRSADAAEEIQGLVQVSLKSINSSGEQVASATDAIKRSGMHVHNGGSKIAQIAGSTGQQRNDIAHVDRVILELYQATRDTLETVAYASSAVEQLHGQGGRLRHAMLAFRLSLEHA